MALQPAEIILTALIKASSAGLNILDKLLRSQGYWPCDGLLDFMSNRGGELAHGSDAVGMRQLALHLAILPLATGALQGNGGLRSEVPE